MISGRGEAALLAWKLGSKGLVVDVVVVHSNVVGGSRGVYRRRRGEETVNTRKPITIQMKDMVIRSVGGNLMQY